MLVQLRNAVLETAHIVCYEYVILAGNDLYLGLYLSQLFTITPRVDGASNVSKSMPRVCDVAEEAAFVQ